MFSLFFGDEFDNVTVTTADANHRPTQSPMAVTTNTSSSSSAPTSDGLFDALKAGLSLIEQNDDTVSTILDSTVKNVSLAPQFVSKKLTTTTTTTTTTTQKPAHKNESQLSFFDILLGDDEDDDDVEEKPTTAKVAIQNQRPLKPEPSTLTQKLKEDFLASIANVRRNEYPVEQREHLPSSTVSAKRTTVQLTTEKVPEVTSEQESLKLLESSYDTSTWQKPFETTTWNVDGSTTDDSWEQLTSTNSLEDNTTEELFTTTWADDLSSTTQDWASTLGTDDDDGSSTLTSTVTDRNEELASTKTEKTTEPISSTVSEVKMTSPDSAKLRTESTTLPAASSSGVPPISSSYLDDLTELLSHNLPASVSKTDKAKTNATIKIKVSNATVPTKTTTSTENIFAAFLDGISDIFSERNLTEPDRGNFSTHFVRKNVTLSKLAAPDGTGNSTRLSQKVSTSSSTSKPSTTTESEKGAISLTTQENLIKPLLINSNPSILESDINYDYSEPTLPPSLPNLKIIPFLPTDALDDSREYYKGAGIKDKHIFENEELSAEYSKESKTAGLSSGFGAAPSPGDVFSRNNAKPDFSSYDTTAGVYAHDSQLYHLSGIESNAAYDGYDHTSYPSITEHYGVDHFPVDGKPYETLYDQYDRPAEYHFDPYSITVHGPLETSSTGSSSSSTTKFGLVNQPNLDGDIAPNFEKFATIYPPSKQNVLSNLDYSTTSSPSGFDKLHNQFSPPIETEGKFLTKA